jgi:hypothetical protein
MTLQKRVRLFNKEREGLDEQFEAIFKRIKTQVSSDDDRNMSWSTYTRFVLDKDQAEVTLVSVQWVGNGETEKFEITIPVDELDDIDTWVADFQQMAGCGSNNEK